MFGLDGKVDCTFVSKLLNLPTCTEAGLLATDMLLGGKERPHVAVLCFSSSGKLLLGGSIVGWRDLKLEEVGVTPLRSPG